MTELAFALLCLACLLAFTNWRRAFFLCVFTALLQDPLRKLCPGQPVLFVVFVGIVFGAGWLGALASSIPLSPDRMTGWRQNVGQPFAIFIALAAAQAANSLMRFGNPVMTGIGVMSYFVPIPAVAMAYRFALSRGEAGILRWMWIYVIAATIALATVYLEFAGFGWSALGEVGEGVYISGAGAYYKGNSGIFRAAEIAAWHAATVGCFAFILFWGRRFSPVKVLVALAFIAFLLGIGALTGRRKMIIEIAIFLSAYFCLVGWFKRGNARFATLAALLGVISYASSIGIFDSDFASGPYASSRVSQTTGNSFGKYSERAQTVFEDVPRRVLELGVEPVSWAVAQYGWLGAGLGVGSQGAQHFGAESSGAAEGGLGKITVELGVPGLLLVLWLMLRFIRYIWRVLDSLSKTAPAQANLGCGIVAFMIANFAAFSVATQAYADLFILLSLGWSFGFLLALPVLAAAKRQRPAVQIAPVPELHTTPPSPVFFADRRLLTALEAEEWARFEAKIASPLVKEEIEP